MQVLRLLAARLSWRPPRSLISLRRCPGFRPCRLCRVSRSASRDSPYARLSRPRLVPRAAGRGSGRVGVERHPLGHARFRAWEPGTLDTWDAQSPQRPRPRGAAGEDETAASCPSVKGDRKIGEAAGGGGGAQLGSAGRGVPWQPGFSHPSRYLPTPLHHPSGVLWCPCTGFQGWSDDPHAAPSRESSEKAWRNHRQFSVILRAEHQPRGS